MDIVTSLCANLDSWVDLLVVAGSDDGEVLGADDAGGVGWALVADSQAVPGDGSLLDVVTGLTTNEEAVRASGHVDNSIDVALSGGVVEECARVDIWVLEGEVDLLGGGALLGWVPQVLEVDLDAWCDNIGELNLAIEERASVP